MLHTSDNVVLDTSQPMKLGRESKFSQKHSACILSVDVMISWLFFSLLLSASQNLDFYVDKYYFVLRLLCFSSNILNIRLSSNTYLDRRIY